jgi:hypothetical protein
MPRVAGRFGVVVPAALAFERVRSLGARKASQCPAIRAARLSVDEFRPYRTFSFGLLGSALYQPSCTSFSKLILVADQEYLLALLQ